MKSHEILNDYPVKIEVPIAWGEMDAFQHVNNIVYFRYFESVRIAYFERIRYMELMRETGNGPILASTQCEFKLPLSYPDTVLVGARISKMEEDRFVMEYCIVSQTFQEIAAVGQGLVVSYNYLEKRKVPLPDQVRQQILELEQLK